MRHEPDGRAGSAIPAVAYLLADHLDAALAAAEDLEAAARSWPTAHTEAAAELLVLRASERRVVERMRAFEAVLITRVLKARERARELARTEAEFARMAELFVAATSSLVDAIAELGDATASDFDTGDSLVAYLRRRGMIDSEAVDLPEGRTIAFDDGFLVAGRIALGPLTEMIIAFIDALEISYDLYPDEAAADDVSDDCFVAATPEEHHGDTAIGVHAATGDAGAERDGLAQSPPRLDATPPGSGQRPS